MSACAVERGYAALAEHLLHTAEDRRLPLMGTCEWTARCNLRCGHCYIIDHGASGGAQRAELDAPGWIGILDELVAAGCLWLGITGGEPMLRPDFPELYRAAWRRGFLISLLTNGTLITAARADLLAGLPPLVVEISLYGASAATYGRVTGDPAAFDACLAGVGRLADRRVRLALKTVLTRDNAADLPEMRSIAARFGCALRVDGALNAHLDGVTPLTGLRLAPAQLVALELAEPAVVDAWAQRAGRLRSARDRTRTRLDCGAALSTFHVDWRGRLSPCSMVRAPAIDVSRGGFARAWNGPLAALARAPASPRAVCVCCELAPVCDQCGGFGQLEHGDPEQPVCYLCPLAQARRSALERLRPEIRWTM